MAADADIEMLWTIMSQVFGSRWVSNYGELPERGLSDTARVWARGLHDVSAAEMKAGIAAVVAAGMDWPPSLGEFRRLCRSETVALPEHNRAAYVIRNTRLLSKPRPSADHARPFIQALRARLNGG